MAAFSLEVRCGQDEVSSSRFHASGESSSRIDVSNLHKFVVHVSNQQLYEYVNVVAARQNTKIPGESIVKDLSGTFMYMYT